jgi:hypothetical protein
MQHGDDKIDIPKLLHALLQHGRDSNFIYVPDAPRRGQLAYFRREHASDEFGRCREGGPLRGEGKRVAPRVDIKPASKGLAVALILRRSAQSRLIAPVAERIKEANRMAMTNEPYSEVANPHDAPPRSRQRDPSWIAAWISRRQIKSGYHARA